MRKMGTNDPVLGKRNGPGLLLPSAAERFIQLDQTSVFIASRAGERQFCAIKRPLPVEHFEIGGGAAFGAEGRNANGFLEIGDTFLLAHSHLMKLLVTDERVGNISKALLDHLPVGD